MNRHELGVRAGIAWRLNAPPALVQAVTWPGGGIGEVDLAMMAALGPGPFMLADRVAFVIAGPDGPRLTAEDSDRFWRNMGIVAAGRPIPDEACFSDEFALGVLWGILGSADSGPTFSR